MIIQKLNSCSDIPASQEGVYLFSNSPFDSATNEICVNSKFVNFQNVCFVNKWRTKSDNGYQIGRGISPDKCPAILYHVIHFSQ